MTSSSNARDIKDAMKGTAEWVSPVNALILASVTIIDICAPALHGQYAKILAVAMALTVIAIAYRFLLIKRTAQPLTAGTLMRAFIRNKINVGLIVAVVCLAAFFTANLAWAKSDEGAIAGVVPSLKTVQASLFRLEGSVARIDSKTDALLLAVAPTDAAGRLNVKHYGLDNESKARAIESCDVEAVQLYLALGEHLPLASPIFGVRAGSNLERPIMEKNPRLPAILDLLNTQHGDLNSRTLLTFVANQSGAIPQFEQLAANARRRNKAIGPVFMQAHVRVTPLVVAIWASNTEAMSKLLALGARTDVGVDASVVGMSQDGKGVVTREVQIASAAEEAKRLGVSLPSQ